MFVRRGKTDSAPVVKLAAAVALVAASLLVGALATPQAQGQGSACTAGDRNAQLSGAQRDILALLHPAPGADLTTLRNEADLAALAALGYSFYPHQQVSVRGMGWPVLDTQNETPTAARPSLLLYAPSGDDFTAPRDGFDFAYRLAGWAYLLGYEPHKLPGDEPDEWPHLSCLGERDWFVHERGIHTFDDGDFDPIRPATGDGPRGSAEGADVPCATDPLSKVFCTDREPGDFGHPRAWDTHVWLDGDQVPTVSMTNPRHKLPGVDAQIGKAFFFPETSE